MSDRPVITFALWDTPEMEQRGVTGETVRVEVGAGLDGIDTRDLAEKLFACARRVEEVRIDLPDGRHWTWVARE